MVSFANTFRELRHKRNMTVYQVAKKLKVNPSTISRWENGLAEPTFTKVFKICKVFRVSIERFVEKRVDEQ